MACLAAARRPPARSVLLRLLLNPPFSGQNRSSLDALCCMQVNYSEASLEVWPSHTPSRVR